MNLYRKKPIVVEAMQWEGGAEASTPIIDWVLQNGGTAVYHEEWVWLSEALEASPPDPEHIAIRTLEGTMKTLAGDWIIRGIQGEFYPCKPDIFESTYERVGNGH